MKQVYTCVDLGSDSIKVVVCEYFNNKINLLAASSIKSKGIKRGLITDAKKACESLQDAILKVEEMLGVKIKEVITSIPSYSLDFEMLKANVDIKNEVVGESDITNVVNKALDTTKIKNKEFVTVLPIDFAIDNNSNVKDPKGKSGNKLATRVVNITTAKKNILSVIKLCEMASLEVIDISLNSIGDVYAIKDRSVKEQIGAVVNIGHETTTVSLYNKGIIVKSSVIPVGGKNITHDIEYIYKLDTFEATRVKEKFALASLKYASKTDSVEVRNKKSELIKIKQYELSEIVKARLDDILIKVKKEINILTNKDIDYIVITGGTSNMTNFNLTAEEYLGNITKVNEIKLVGLRHNKYSTAVGNIVYFISKLKLKGKNYSMFSEDEMEMLSSSKRNIVSSDTTLGKLFGYFFSE